MAPAGFTVDYHIPVSNRQDTIQGVSLAVQILAWIAVTLRLWVRFRLSRSPGLDDLFVVLACISVTWGTIEVVFQTYWGLGLHLYTVLTYTLTPPGEPLFYAFSRYLKYLWLANISYACSTTLIKLSILLQFRRLFDRKNHRVVNIICLCLIAVVAAWGLFFVLVTIFGCTPIRKQWNFLMPGKCIMFGTKIGSSLFPAYATHTASNMCLDIFVLAVPLPSLATSSLGKKQRAGLIGVFSIGLIVVICSILRLWLIVRTRVGTYPTNDGTWFAPGIVIMSCLEVNLAVTCSSMPIFWPYLPSISFSGIKVVREVIVDDETRREPLNNSDNNKSVDSEGHLEAGFGRRQSDASDARLALKHIESPAAHQMRQYYKDSHVKGLVLGDLVEQEMHMDDGTYGLAPGRQGHTAAAWTEPLELRKSRSLQ